MCAVDRARQLFSEMAEKIVLVWKSDQRSNSETRQRYQTKVKAGLCGLDMTAVKGKSSCSGTCRRFQIDLVTLGNDLISV